MVFKVCLKCFQNETQTYVDLRLSIQKYYLLFRRWNIFYIIEGGIRWFDQILVCGGRCTAVLGWKPCQVTTWPREQQEIRTRRFRCVQPLRRSIPAAHLSRFSQFTWRRREWGCRCIVEKEETQEKARRWRFAEQCVRKLFWPDLRPGADQQYFGPWITNPDEFHIC